LNQSPWRVILLVSLVTFVAYLVRTDVSVAQERMVPAINISIVAMGAITAWGFQLTYALFQVPAGLFGERFGTRTTLAIALLGCSAASFITAALPNAGAIPVLIGTRVLLGIAQAAVFPVAAMAVALFVPVAERVRALAIIIATASLGAAAAPLMMAPVMERFGWRAVFLLSGAIALLTCIVWVMLMPPHGRAAPRADRPATPGVLHGLRALLRSGSLRQLSLA